MEKCRSLLLGARREEAFLTPSMRRSPLSERVPELALPSAHGRGASSGGAGAAWHVVAPA